MSEIERNLHQMSQILRREDTIKLVVRLEPAISSRIRYLAVVCCPDDGRDEYCALGIDCNDRLTLGLVLAILTHTSIRLDGDGGFCITDCIGQRSYIFKPVSVQTMWSALQSLYKASDCAKRNKCYQISAVNYYNNVFLKRKSDPGKLIEWNSLPGVQNTRPIYSNLSADEVSFHVQVRSALREILLAENDLDEVTSREIRSKLELKLEKDLFGCKSFIDEEMLQILGQMDAPAMILDHLYLGTEWNASHQQDLFDRGIGYVLNVTAEIDNFFPGTFHYMNIPVSDSEDTDLLRYFTDSYKFIAKAQEEGKNVLVHCKMGISRSATIVIAYVMKNRNWNLGRSVEYVTERRSCVKPNPNFMKQLEIYEGILNAKRYSGTLEKRFKTGTDFKEAEFVLKIPQDVRDASTHALICYRASKTTFSKYYNTYPVRLKAASSLAYSSRAKSRSTNTISNYLHSQGLETALMNMRNHYVETLERLEQSSVCPSFDDSAINSFHPLSKRLDSFIFQNEVDAESPAEALYVEDGGVNHEGSSYSAPFLGHTEGPSNMGSSFTSQCSSGVPCLPQRAKSDVLANCGLISSESPNATENVHTKVVLKCSRHPFNGDTFSVSPNQVINISSVTDHLRSRVRVRHLVSEFELHNNRQCYGSSGDNVQGDGVSRSVGDRTWEVHSATFLKETGAGESGLHELDSGSSNDPCHQGMETGPVKPVTGITPIVVGEIGETCDRSSGGWTAHNQNPNLLSDAESSRNHGVVRQRLRAFEAKSVTDAEIGPADKIKPPTVPHASTQSGISADCPEEGHFCLDKPCCLLACEACHPHLFSLSPRSEAEGNWSFDPSSASFNRKPFPSCQQLEAT